ncbi:hypothetical protein ACJ6WE_23520 [Streptomyces sp. MMS24-I31]|uniref:hypothetical protein n=1 Tax=Streptomyces sp. MMS24-I31 TaxID=3351563 RepID=UPI003896D639
MDDQQQKQQPSREEEFAPGPQRAPPKGAPPPGPVLYDGNPHAHALLRRIARTIRAGARGIHPREEGRRLDASVQSASQFSRHVRPGTTTLDTGVGYAAAALDEGAKRLVIVAASTYSARTLSFAAKSVQTVQMDGVTVQAARVG